MSRWEEMIQAGDGCFFLAYLQTIPNNPGPVQVVFYRFNQWWHCFALPENPSSRSVSSIQHEIGKNNLCQIGVLLPFFPGTSRDLLKSSWGNALEHPWLKISRQREVAWKMRDAQVRNCGVMKYQILRRHVKSNPVVGKFRLYVCENWVAVF